MTMTIDTPNPTVVDPVIEAERFILGTALTETDHTPGADDLTVGDFYLPRHGAIWRAIQQARAAGEPVDPVSVSERLRQAGDLQRAGGLPYLTDCTSTAMGPGTVAHHAEIVRSAARRRLRHQLLARAAQLVDDDDAWEQLAPELLTQLSDPAAARPAAGGRHAAKIRAALVTTEQLDDIPELEPLIGDMLYRNSAAWLIGPPANGKSFVALDMAGSVATGQTWQGSPVEQGPVLYLVAEGLTGVKQRIRAWESGQNLKMTGLTILPMAVQAAEPDEWDALVVVAAETRPHLVVVDTQARVTVGMEENSARDMGMFVQRVEQLREATGACVLVVHHQGRNGEHMRGSTALEGAATTVIKVKKADDLLTVECVKQKDAPEFDAVTLRLVPHDPSAILALTDPSLGGDPTALLESHWLKLWWESHESDEVSVSVLTKTNVVSEATFHRQKFALIRAGLVERTGQGRSVRYKLTRKP